MCTPTSSQPDTSRAAATLLSSTSESRAADTPSVYNFKSNKDPIVHKFKSSSKDPIVYNQKQ